MIVPGLNSLRYSGGMIRFTTPVMYFPCRLGLMSTTHPISLSIPIVVRKATHFDPDPQMTGLLPPASRS